VIGDPSHATGDWTKVEAASRNVLLAGAHGLLVEVLPPSTERSELQCDPGQGVPADVLRAIVAFAAGMSVAAPVADQPVGAGAES
jgi:3-deoxy-D-arabino-heptulosonate 7-phosphate (DAHP) synthase